MVGDWGSGVQGSRFRVYGVCIYGIGVWGSEFRPVSACGFLRMWLARPTIIPKPINTKSFNL